ncbi:NTP transferase domain-containing protein [Algihabitans albus]|uniref:NTP transferase domain-containing protein n=1 Tax=Algihabitans albus TaxID=2164067 RepID=UPI000E5CB319|nr:molybdopterin-binding/glycosyltransferase family 2 protein [Algihabitans albus]
MIFGPTPLDQAEGAILAHSLKQGEIAFKKGRRLSAEDVRNLRSAQIHEVIAARLEEGDLHEDEAARRLAEVAAGNGAKVTEAFTGRCNLVAEAHGLVQVEAERLDELNLIDEALTIATLPDLEPVEPRQMLATVKIIPFAAPTAALARCLEIAGSGAPLVRVAPFAAKRVGLVQTRLPGQKERLLDKTRDALDARLAALGSAACLERRCGHQEAEVAEGLAALRSAGCEILLVSGASAIVDRRDVVPAGIERTGGRVRHFGMPVDPGNLLLLAEWDGLPVLGLPGCARSPKINGFDWVLQRFAAGLSVEPRDVMRMGVGGLLKEIGGRPLPRAEAVESSQTKRAPRIAALVLAAGQSRRYGRENKLLAEMDGLPLVRYTVAAAQASQADPVLLVTGHARESVEAAVAETAVALLHNADYAQGLSTSLRRGLAGLPDDIDGVVVLLGDMPKVDAKTIDKLIAAFDPLEGRAICIPTSQGKRGNPVLFARRFFAEAMEIAGDVGAKPLIADHADQVAEVPVDGEAVLLDVDTPAALARLTG